jgi:predicted GIY-YIG superfamily endonuclease
MSRYLIIHHDIGMKYYLYELVSPIDNNCFYIGITSSPRRRYRQHLAGQCPSTKGFISYLAERGLKPLHNPAAEFSSLKEAHDLEQALIKESIRSRTPLCNNRFGRVLHKSIPNHGAAWSDAEIAHVLELHRRGSGIDDIALAIGRSRSSIRWALRRHGDATQVS